MLVESLDPPLARAEDGARPPTAMAEPASSSPPADYAAATLSGASGLMRVVSASSGSAGSLRLAVLSGFYSGSGFLCPPCAVDGDIASAQDSVDNVSANFYISSTPLEFLEGYVSVFSHATSTDQPQPSLRQIVGDWALGAKAFTPLGDSGLLHVGGSVDLAFSTGTGRVGVFDVGAVNLGLRALSSVDFRALESGLPVRAHVNLGYLFDNSSGLVEDFEQDNAPVDRVQRFSLGVSRVDSFQVGVGVEGLLESANPFLEWTADIPTNYRNGYRCPVALAVPGETCLEGSGGLGVVPSRLTMGVRARPWELLSFWVRGLSAQVALDVATGASSEFLVEVRPELPWKLWGGLSYAVGEAPPPPAVLTPAPRPPRLFGVVVDQETGAGIADARVRLEGRQLSGFITNGAGQFLSSDLGPEVFTLAVEADGYQAGQCRADLSRPPAPQALAGQGASPVGPLAVPPDAHRVRCELEKVPQVATLIGQLVDWTTGQPVGEANVKMVDALGRPLSIRVDAAGRFGFDHIVPGPATVEVAAPGFLRSVTALEFRALDEIDGAIMMTPQPAAPRVTVGPTRIRLDRSLEFEDGTPQLIPESLGLLQELASVLALRPLQGQLVVRAHSGLGGQAALALSEERAATIREVLVLHGVDADKVRAEGVGDREPLVQGAGEAARQRNERVQLQIIPTGAGAGAGAPTRPNLPDSSVLQELLGTEPNQPAEPGQPAPN